QDRENRKRLCLYNFSWMETVSPASMGQPTPIHRPDEDLRNVGTPPREFIEEVYLTRPFSYREEFFGSYDESGNPTYAEDAGDDDGQHKPGTFLFGGKHIMPPGISLDHIKSERTGDKNLSEVAVSHHSDYTFTVYGEPIFSDDPDVSGKWKGFGTIRNSTTDRLETYHAPATGVRTLISEIDSRGRDRKLCIGTYGDGDDGDVTTAGPFTNLSAVKYYENLTIDTADAMNARSLPVFVKDTLTISAGGYFHTFVEGGAGGDEGGAGASGASERWYGASGAGGEGGQSGGSGAAGTSAGPSLGGSGGSGGAGTSGSAGAAGSATAPSYFPRFLEALLHGQDRDLSGYQGGAGGGGGGGGAGSDAGGGGSGGGVMVIVARHLVLDTSGGALFRSLGSNGGAGFNDGSGGGGGGGGGFVCLVYQTAEDQDGNPLSESDLLELIDVSGGSGGAGQGSGGNGADGTGGNKMVICHG
ncbi:MAG: hypothetical protein P1V97_23485, partial [Planctomycetota bacterium]|nr:hypothetical protein [Planctomycetota bacterium]